VTHGFSRLGLIEYPAAAGDSEKVFEAAIEAGAEDVESDEDSHQIWTAVDDLHGVARALEAALGEAESVKLAWRAQTMVEVGESDAVQLMRLVETLEEDDDVQTVWGNYEMSDEVLEKLG
jgi:transcriptional/translational regulatory protein YebC/TACO1